MDNTTAENRYANRALLFVTLACIIPLLIIFSVSLSNPGSPFLNQIADATRSTPSVTSAFNPVMTKVMDIYVKSAPVAGILAFMFLLKKRKPLEIKKRAELIRACFLSPFVYVFFIYFFLMHNLELTTAGRTVRWMSENNFSLLLFYIMLYIATFFITYAVCYTPVLACKLMRERQ